MRFKFIFLPLFFSLVNTLGFSQLGRINVGLNLRIAYLTAVQSDQFTELRNHYGSTVTYFYASTPLTIRYFGSHKIGFEYQLENRKQKHNYFDFTQATVQTETKFINQTIKTNYNLYESPEIFAWISIGGIFTYNYFEKYAYLEYPKRGDSTYYYTSNKFHFSKFCMQIAIGQETLLTKKNKESSGKSKVSFFSELFINTPALNNSDEIPIFSSIEIGTLFGLSFNFGDRNSK